MKEDLLEIMYELNYQCEYCPFRERCAEDKCVYFRIEKIVNKMLDEKVYQREEDLANWLKEMLDNENDIFSVIRVKDILDKINELKGSDIK